MNLINCYLKKLNSPLKDIPLIGEKRKFFLKKHGVTKVRDLILLFPKRFIQEDAELREGDLCITLLIKRKIRNKIFIVEADFKGSLVKMVFFNIRSFNIFSVNSYYKVFGKFEKKGSFYEVKHVQVLNRSENKIPSYNILIPDKILNKVAISIIDEMPWNEKIIFDLSLKEALKNLHLGFDLEKSMSVLKYLEAMMLIKSFEAKDFYEPLDFDLSILKNLPFKPNDEQENAIGNIVSDLKKNVPMKHLVFGEVGSGKTMVALASILLMVQAGFSCILLAPTAALAKQHYDFMLPIFEKMNNTIALLTGSVKKKKQVQEKIRQGAFDLIISTHAVLYMEEIPNLGLLIVDEMQRFGVLQRSKLLLEAKRKNLLMLSATPIPRSLNFIVSDLISTSKLKSAVFKKQIKTVAVSAEGKADLIQKIMQSGKKGYWVLPSIEDMEENPGVLRSFEEFKEKGFENLILLHGKMKDSEKIDAIEDFKMLKSGILVSTTVIETGIDIPDADLIIIENPAQFGLAQLHQLRGRVGRRGQEAFCILLYYNFSKKINLLKKTLDGFEIAQADLDLRGAGEYAGLRQHGENAFMFLNLSDDIDFFNKAKKDKRVLDEFSFFFGSDEIFQ